MRTSFLIAALLCATPALADDRDGMEGMDMAAMDMSGMADMPGMAATGTLGDYPVTRDASGTSWQPDAASHRGIHLTADDWAVMLHARLVGTYDSQSGPRGGDDTFLAGMVMAAARRDFAGGDTLNLRAMLSPDPFMGRAGYPLLLASGETADGTAPLIDRQHPHDLLMELSASYSHRLSGADSVFVYAGYPGEPALGPAAFMHRASSEDMPAAPITHHWLDSTHITFGVVTAGYVRGDWKIEVSQFTGREPDQFRFDFDPARFDSTAARLSWNPTANWSLQASWGFLKSPEQLEPAVNETRYTASATYVLPLADNGSFAATLAFGRKQLSGGTAGNGVLAEAEYKPAEAWTLFARAESIDSGELFSSPGIKTAGEVSLGAIHDWRVAEHLSLGLGGGYSFDIVPSGLPSYGSAPHGAMVFLRAIAD
ncbi:MAG TPA: hypothetical protein VGB91_01140 [Rhizomicrobium sp.]